MTGKGLWSMRQNQGVCGCQHKSLHGWESDEKFRQHVLPKFLDYVTQLSLGGLEVLSLKT